MLYPTFKSLAGLFAWDIIDFSHLQVNKKHSVSINSMSKVVLITLDLFSVEVSIQKRPSISPCVFSDPTIEFLTFNYFLMDAEGQRVDCGKQEILSDQFKKETTFALPLSKTKIMQNKEQYLVKDALLLRCEYSFSTGDILEGIERIDFETSVPKRRT
ncbi:hypothetical protein CDAR_114161 [Caerostris darwini]|uniref:Uncharacterized protein n=1 Tax=Caerostris darwini TaxID=1538125 RepID=A0AAV4W1C9_9ARAC|nr:hypothetical protein CDAR_114161 [Caerostris darwini]